VEVGFALFVVTGRIFSKKRQRAYFPASPLSTGKFSFVAVSHFQRSKRSSVPTKVMASIRPASTHGDASEPE
jgi:hypothetical protein